MTRTGTLLVVLCVATAGCGSSPHTRADDSGTNTPDGGQEGDQGAGLRDAGSVDSGSVDADCACPESEPCCDDACGFRPATYRCQGPLEATRVRNVCTGVCGGTAVPEFEVQYCTGASSACDGATAWYDHIICPIVPPCSGFHVCDPGERCVPFDPMPVADLTSIDMLCEPHASCSP